MENKEKIKKTINTQLPFLKDEYHVKRLGLFGSVIRGEQNKDSDIDIMVEFSQPISFFEFIRLEEFLSKTLRKKVDLVSKKAIKPAVKDEILKETIYV